MPSQPQRLGDYLLEQGAITPDQLKEALSLQASAGARLGTNLLDLQFISLDELAHHLAAMHGCPIATEEAFQNVSHDAIKRVPKRLCERYLICPLRLERDKILYLAMCDPQDLRTIDEVSFALGLNVRPFSAPEVRLRSYLEEHYAVMRNARLIQLEGRLSGSKDSAAGQSIPPTGSHGAVEHRAESFTGPLPAASRAPTNPGTAHARPPNPATAQHATATRPDASATTTALPSNATGPHPVTAGPHARVTGPIEVAPPSAPTANATAGRATEMATEDNEEEDLVYLDEVMADDDPDDADFDISLDLSVFEEDMAEPPPSSSEPSNQASLASTASAQFLPRVKKIVARLNSASTGQLITKLLTVPVAEPISMRLVMRVKDELATGLYAGGIEAEPAHTKLLNIHLGLDSVISKAFRDQIPSTGHADPGSLGPDDHGAFRLRAT